MPINTGAADAEPIRDYLQGIASGAGKLDLSARRMRGDRRLPAGL
jgi:hypothetical protein